MYCGNASASRAVDIYFRKKIKLALSGGATSRETNVLAMILGMH